MPKKTEAGKYRGRVQIGVDKDGKAINKYVCAGTLRELEATPYRVDAYFKNIKI